MQESSRKLSTSTLLTIPNPLTVWITTNWKTLQEMGIPDHLTCLLRNLYAGQEATVRTEHRTDWFQIGKGVHQSCILSPCLFNLYVEYITQNARLDEAHAGIKIAGRNINNLRYADDTNVMTEKKKEGTVTSSLKRRRKPEETKSYREKKKKHGKKSQMSSRVGAISPLFPQLFGWQLK